MLKAYLDYAEELRPHVTDTSVALGNIFDAHKKVLFEGAQATFLDIDYGTYPYVTSSNPTAGNAATGSGVGPRFIDHVVGVVKAYTTRVGEGPFVCELFDTDGPGTISGTPAMNSARSPGGPRRCGWLDASWVKYAARLNSMDALAITRLDILDGMDEIKMCTGWTIDGEPIQHIPADLTILAKAKPVYETFKGWKKDISGYGPTATCRRKPRPI